MIKTLSLAFVVIPHGQQFRALMQKELEFNKIGMIETSAVLAGFPLLRWLAPISGRWR
ncbi:hypothetical protein O5478_18260 [Escherichia coli]|nr:hypothetical protein [Escherichia coli]